MNPVGLPEGKLHCWCFSESHDENVQIGQDLGYFELPNGFIVDIGYYDEYCTKVSLNCRDDYTTRWIEIDLGSLYLEFTSKRPVIALAQFVEIANYFSELKIQRS